MVLLSNEQIEELANSILGNVIEISAIGNHHLCRHLVFKVINELNQCFVLKIYYKKGSRDCERAALDELSDKKLKTTTIVNHGEFLDHEWVLYDYIEGTLLDNVMDDIEVDQQNEIFYELGEIFALMHQRTYDAIGYWDANKTIDNPVVDIDEWMAQHVNELVEDMRCQEFHNNDYIKKLCEEVKAIDFRVFNDAPISLVHFDLDGRNIIVNNLDGFQLNGIIDFESSRPWLRDRSFVPLYFRYFYDRSDLKLSFWSGYQKISLNDVQVDDVIEHYLKIFILSNLTWCKKDAPDYYEQNLLFLQKKIA